MVMIITNGSDDDHDCFGARITVLLMILTIIAVMMMIMIIALMLMMTIIGMMLMI